MKKLFSSLTASPKTHEQLQFRTHLRLGAMVIIGLVLFLAIKFWVVTILLTVLGVATWRVIKHTKR